MSWLPLGDFGDNIQNGADCWGYVSPSGREYAIFGHWSGTAFVEITEPGNAQLVAQVDGPDSLWRDIKVYQNYAFSVNETAGGIQVIDLSDIDLGLVTELDNVTTGGTESTHNVAIDEESGFLYRCGGTSGGDALRIYDLANPASPLFLGSWPDRYVHDAQIVTYPTGRQVAFCCSGFNSGWAEPGLDIVDVTDEQNPKTISRLLYEKGEYSHQAWLSPDRRYLYLNDELDERDLGIPTTIRIFDVVDLAHPVEVATFTNGNRAIGHNLYIVGDVIYLASLRSGLRVFRSTDPFAPAEVAFFDTHPENDAPDFDGLWNVYPYFPSGTVIGSDMNRGLFVWNVDTSQPPLPPAPNPNISASPQAGPVPLVVNFMDQSTGSVESYTWDFGDGTTSSEQHPTHTYDELGFYTVTLTVTGPAGTDTRTFEEFINGTFETLFIRSDCDGNQQLNLADPLLLLGVLFDAGAEPSCLKACDFDDTGTLNLGDVYLNLQQLFQAGVAPAAPYPNLGVDRTPDTLPCS